jgi:signal transduction histidine kinase
VVLEVSSTGIGVDEETQFRLFEPFFSARGSQGTGLGLSNVYDIVKQYEGDLVVESELGRGFKVYLAQVE